MSIPRSIPAVIMVACLLFSAACATVKPRKPDTGTGLNATAPGKANGSGSEAKGESELPPEVESALMPEIRLDSSQGPDDRKTRLNITANDVPAREFFMSLAQDSEYNMTVHPEVQGRISLRLSDVSVPEVLEVVHNVYGYPFEATQNGYQIMPAGLQTRVFQIDYLNLKRKGESQTRVSSGQVSEKDVNDDDNGEYTADRTSVTGTSIKTRSESDFWQELRTSLETIVGTQQGRKVIVMPQASMVAVRAMPLELRDIRSYLQSMQSNLLRQVVLEAKILEVTLDSGYQTGINWSALLGSGDSEAAITQTGGGSVFDTGRSETAGETVDISPVNPDVLAGNAASAFGGVFSAAVDINDFTAFIELLKSQGDVQVLSSPRIATLNNQKAVIKVGQDDFFVTDISSETIVGGDATTTSPDITLTPFFSGIALDVTPHVNSSREVTLHIHPTVSEVTEETKTLSVTGTTQTLPLASSSVRESDSIVRAKSGQVVVIGGLMQNRTEDRTAGIPILGDIPLLGRAFRHTKKVSEKSELVILLRPQVAPYGRTWNPKRAPSKDRLQSEGWEGWSGGSELE